jgi:hypothetical protein
MESLINEYIENLKVLKIEFRELYKYYIKYCKKNDIKAKYKTPFAKELYSSDKVSREIKHGLTFVCIQLNTDS